MFYIEYYIDGEDPTEPVIMINDPDIRSITISELKDSTTYGVRIQAINSGGPSEYSTPVTQTTHCELLKMISIIIFHKCFSALYVLHTRIAHATVKIFPSVFELYKITARKTTYTHKIEFAKEIKQILVPTFPAQGR